MTVTALRQLSAERYELSFSDGTAAKTTLSVIADLSLYTGRELTDAEYESVISASELARAKERAMRIIGARAMSERELYDRLVEKGETEENAAACVQWLISLHLLDDAEYAAMTVRHYAAKGYGKRRIQSELYRRKIPKRHWESALAGLPEQDETIDRLLRSRLRSPEPDRAEIKRASDFLLRRGFSWSEIREALARYEPGIEEEY